jgi:hypothetical protein
MYMYTHTPMHMDTYHVCSHTTTLSVSLSHTHTHSLFLSPSLSLSHTQPFRMSMKRSSPNLANSEPFSLMEVGWGTYGPGCVRACARAHTHTLDCGRMAIAHTAGVAIHWGADGKGGGGERGGVRRASSSTNSSAQLKSQRV